MTDTPEPSKLDVDKAFQALFTGKPMEPEAKPEAAPEPQAAAPVAEQVETTPATEIGADQPVEIQEPETEDVESLRKRLVSREEELQEQLAKVRQQGSQGIEWARNLGLRKASEAARAKDLLKRIKAGEQVPAEEVDAILSASTDVSPLGATPQPQLPQLSNPFAPPPQAPEVSEDMVSQTQQFMIDYGLDDQQGEALIKWMQDPSSQLTQRDVVPNSLYHTLVMAKTKYDRAQQDQKSIKAKAIASIGKTQREAAKAAGALGGKASPSPPADKPVDWTKLPTEERKKYLNVDELLRQMAEG